MGFLILNKELQWGCSVPTPRAKWRPELAALAQNVCDLSSQPPSVLLHLWGDENTMTKALQAKRKVPQPMLEGHAKNVAFGLSRVRAWTRIGFRCRPRLRGVR